MAEIEVQPKKKSSLLPWLLLGLGLIALLFFLFRDRGTNEPETAAAATSDTLSSAGGNAAMGTGTDGWADVDFNAPTVRYNEVTNSDIEVRGNDQYGIYGIGEDILFDTDQATIRQGAEANLKQIAGSIGQRYGGGNIRVYGYTDAQGSAGYNKELAEQRAEAVRNWLVQQGGVTEGNVSVHPVGEARPVASNATEQGRQQNRRVEIVARGGADSTSGNSGAAESTPGGATGTGSSTGEQPNL